MVSRLRIGFGLMLAFFFYSKSIVAQEKFEREYHIKTSQVPDNALNFINACNFDKKVKWYAEESQIGKTFETKTRFKKSKFSIEFDENGLLLDTEEKVKFKKLTIDTQQRLSEQLALLFDHYKIHKIQKQWLGTELAIRSYLSDRNSIKGLTLNYEVVIMGKKKGQHTLYEVLFTDDFGSYEIRKIIQKETDNLEF